MIININITYHESMSIVQIKKLPVSWCAERQARDKRRYQVKETWDLKLDFKRSVRTNLNTQFTGDAALFIVCNFHSFPVYRARLGRADGYTGGTGDAFIFMPFDILCQGLEFNPEFG